MAAQMTDEWQSIADSGLRSENEEERARAEFFQMLASEHREMFGSSGGTAQAWELTPLSNRPDFSHLREVGINLVTSTRSNDPNVNYQLGAGEVTGNRTTGLPTSDGKRRRVNSARVRLRNVI